MSKIRIKRTSVVKDDPTLLAGELGISGDKMYYGPKGTDVNDNELVTAVRIAGTNINNTFIGENTFRNSGDSILFQNESGTTLYKVVNGKIQAATSNLGATDLVPRQYVDNKVDGAIAASDALILKGTVDGSTGTISSADSNLDGKTLGAGGGPIGYKVGWSLKVSVAGTILGSQKVEVGDLVVVMKVTDVTLYNADDFHIFQTNVDFSTLGTNIAKLSGAYGLVGSTSGGLASIVTYPQVKDRLAITWTDIGGAAPYADKDHTHQELKMIHNGVNKNFVLSIDEASANLGAPFFSLVNGAVSVLKGQDYSDRFQFETSRAKFTFNKPLYINAKKVLTEGDFGTAAGTVAEGNHTHTASDVGAVPTSRTINGKALTSNITLTASDVSAVPTSRTINSKALTSNITLTASDVSAVPTSRTINGKALSSNISLTASDVGAKPNFTENNAFNKSFGTAAGTVAEGNHTHFGLVLPKTSPDAGQAALSLFEELNGTNGATIKNGVRFFHQAGGMGQYLEIARTGSGVEFNSDETIYFNNPIDATIDCGL